MTTEQLLSDDEARFVEGLKGLTSAELSSVSCVIEILANEPDEALAIGIAERVSAEMKARRNTTA